MHGVLSPCLRTTLPVFLLGLHLSCFPAVAVSAAPIRLMSYNILYDDTSFRNTQIWHTRKKDVARIMGSADIIGGLRVNRSGVAEGQNSLQALGFMATNLNPISPDALLKIVEQVKEDYGDPPPKRQRGRPRTFSGLAFLLLAVVGGGAADVQTRGTADALDQGPHPAASAGF